METNEHFRCLPSIPGVRRRDSTSPDHASLELRGTVNGGATSVRFNDPELTPYVRFEKEWGGQLWRSSRLISPHAYFGSTTSLQ